MTVSILEKILWEHLINSLTRAQAKDLMNDLLTLSGEEDEETGLLEEPVEPWTQDHQDIYDLVIERAKKP